MPLKFKNDQPTEEAKSLKKTKRAKLKKLVEAGKSEKTGTGRILSSDRNIIGQNTNFVDECAVGDILVVYKDGVMLEREIRSITSTRCMAVDVRFDNNIITSVPFKLRNTRVQAEVGVGEERLNARIKQKSDKYCRN